MKSILSKTTFILQICVKVEVKNQQSENKRQNIFSQRVCTCRVLVRHCSRTMHNALQAEEATAAAAAAAVAAAVGYA
jgi:hypothetical protein